MKKFLVLLVLLVCAALASCNKSDNGQSTADNEQSTTGKGFNGSWCVSINGETQNTTIATGSGYMNFNGMNYSGSGTDTHFSGVNTVSNSGATTKTSLSISRNGDRISGSISVKITVSGYTSQSSGSFSGYRIN